MEENRISKHSHWEGEMVALQCPQMYARESVSVFMHEQAGHMCMHMRVLSSICFG